MHDNKYIGTFIYIIGSQWLPTDAASGCPMATYRKTHGSNNMQEEKKAILNSKGISSRQAHNRQKHGTHKATNKAHTL